MNQKHVRIVIKADGTCTIDAMHFTDASCKQATQQIMQALSGKLVEERLKPEAQRLPPQANQQKEGAR